ncbi:MAG: tRNA (adenosine(37)-N6)-threonylcarbamoyltransferase complex transferase subunit TsaD [Patescibacteria group bacterium]
MKILAIETSCDDTGVAVLEIRGNKTLSFNALSNVVSSQIEVHKKYGGVYPAMAKREHQKNLVPTLRLALRGASLLKIFSSQFLFNSAELQRSGSISNKFSNAKKILDREQDVYKKLIPFLQKYEKPNIDLIAVTNGPGIEPCLWVGINFAKALSYFWSIPIIPVNHIESHILVNMLENRDIKFPAIALIVSGGHTQIILMEKIGKYKILGETRDDAAGECFDKCAKILGLGYPGGPIISKLAEGLDIDQNLDKYFGGHRKSPEPQGRLKLPRPMINTKDYDFSFSGLKTAVLYHHKKQVYTNYHDRRKSCTLKYKQEMAAEIQQAIIDVLIKKTIKAAKDYKVKTAILGGGVSANQELRKQLKEKIKKELPDTQCLIPNTQLSTDNALMTAITCYFHKKKKIAWQKIKAEANLRL